MNLQKISGITFLFLLISNTVTAAPLTYSSHFGKYDNALADSTAAGVKTVDTWISDTQNKLSSLEAVLNDSDPKAVFKNLGFIDLRKSILSPDLQTNISTNPVYQALKDKLAGLRQEYDRRGVFTGNWSDWNFDGQTLTDNDRKLISSVESQLADIRNATVPSDKTDITIKKVFDLLNGTDFSSSPALTYYKQNVGADLLKGAMYKNAINRISQIAGEYRGLISRVGAKNNLHQHDKEFAAKIVNEIDLVKNAGLDLKHYKIKVNDKNPLSAELTLDQIRDQLANI